MNSIDRFENLYSLQSLIVEIITNFMYSNSDYYFKTLNQMQAGLFSLSIIIITLVFLIGGNILTKYIHRSLNKTKLLITTLNLDIIVDNPYFQSYIQQGLKRVQP